MIAMVAVFAFVAANSMSDDVPAKSADALVAAIEKAKVPDRPSAKNARLLKTYPQRRNRALADRARLIGDLLVAAPEHELLVTLLPERWDTLLNQGMKNPKTLSAEIRGSIAGPLGERIRLDASYYLAVVAIRTGDAGLASVPAEVDDFLKRAPDDPRGAVLLHQAGLRLYLNPELQKQAFTRVITSYPKSPIAAKLKRELASASEAGAPFTIGFRDFLTGNEVSNRTLKGKVLVIDFWATWCGPCVGEMPKMKELYAKYRPRGVEFIGVSLDQSESQGGDEKLRKFLLANEIPWPQYYQGKGWESEFSSLWGIQAIPAVFVVDRAGRLVSRFARGKLDEILPVQLERSGR